MATDEQLIQIVTEALARTAASSGDWLACRPGCSQCCTGVFAIDVLDARRLRAGLADLWKDDPAKAARVEQRVEASLDQLGPTFPGNRASGALGESEDARAAFEEFANDAVCPVLDPETGTCDLYASRPMTCRVFGPPVRTAEGLGVCELCYAGASEEQIAACEMVLNTEELEARIRENLPSSELEQEPGATIVAYALRKRPWDRE